MQVWSDGTVGTIWYWFNSLKICIGLQASLGECALAATVFDSRLNLPTVVNLLSVPDY